MSPINDPAEARTRPLAAVWVVVLVALAVGLAITGALSGTLVLFGLSAYAFVGLLLLLPRAFPERFQYGGVLFLAYIVLFVSGSALLLGSIGS
jgi:hypothetical protein